MNIDFYKLAQPSLCQTHIFFMEEQTIDIEMVVGKIDALIAKEVKIRDQHKAAGTMGEWTANSGLINLNQMIMQRQIAAERLHDSEVMIKELWDDYHEMLKAA